MEDAHSFPPKPKGLLKLFYKFPTNFFKWHLGWIFGHRFLMITHIGRKSGKRYQTVLEVIRYTPATQEYIIISGYGSNSDWFKNITKTPIVDVQVKNKHFTPKQKILSAEETFQIFDAYRVKHPFAFKEIIWGMRYPYDGTTESLRSICNFIHGISLKPQKI